MGSYQLKGGKLTARCCHGICFGIGFLLAAFFFSVMFWIVWCYLGLSIVQVSDSQRRGAPFTYSFPSTAAPPNRTEIPAVASSINTISRSATTSTTAARVHGRGDSSPLTSNRGKSSDRSQATSLAKGDFADRSRANATVRTSVSVRTVHSQGVTTSPPHIDDTTKTASILTADEYEGIHPRRVATSGGENLPQDNVRKEPDSRQQVDIPAPRGDIVPTKAYDADVSRPSKDEDKTPPSVYIDPGRDLPRTDDIQSSRRHSQPDTSIRDPDFERDYPRSVSRDRSRYDRDEDLRGSKSRYDTRDRGRDTDDRLSKGDTRVFSDDFDRSSRRGEERDRTSVYEDRDRDRRIGDEDRDRDRTPVYVDRDTDRRPAYEDRDRRPAYEDRDRRPVYEDRDRKKVYEDRDRRPEYDDRDRRPEYDDRDRKRVYEDRDRRPLYDDRERDRRPVTEDRDRDRRPLTEDRDRDRRPVYEDRERRPVDEDRNRDRKPAYEDRDRDKRPMYEDQDRDKRPLYEDRDRDRRPVDDSRNRDRKPAYEDRDRDRRPTSEDRTKEYRDRNVDDRRQGDRDDEYSYRSQDDGGRYRDRPQDDRPYRDDGYRYPPRDDDGRRRDEPRRGDPDYLYPVSGSRSPVLPPVDRRPLPGRQNSGSIDDGRSYVSSDRERSKIVDPIESRSRTSVDDRYKDDDYRRPPSSYDDRERIAPTRVTGDFGGSKSSPFVSRDETYDSRPSDDRPRDRVPSRIYDRYSPEEDRRYSIDRVKETRYYDDDDRRTNTRLISPSSVVEPGNSRRPLSDHLPRTSDDREYRTRTSDDREYRTRLPEERKSDGKYDNRKDEVVLENRSYASDEIEESPRDSRTSSYQDDDRYVRKIRPGDEEYVRRSRPDDDGYSRDRSRGDYDTDRPRNRDGHDDIPSTSRKHDRPIDDRTTRRDLDDIVPKKESSPRDSFVDSRDRGYYPEDRPARQDDPRHPARSDDDRSGSRRDSYSRKPPVDVKRYHAPDDKEVRPLSAQDVIEAAQRHAEAPEQNKKVFYPVFDPRASNLTSPDFIRPSERKGITYGSRRRRRTLK